MFPYSYFRSCHILSEIRNRLNNLLWVSDAKVKDIMSIIRGVLAQSPELEAHDKVLTTIQIELEFGNVGF